jgi:integrase
LKSLDRFLTGKDCESTLSKEFALEWLSPQPYQKSVTIGHSIQVLQQLADYMNRNGFTAYRIPNDLIPKHTHEHTPYIFTYEEIERFLKSVDTLPDCPNSPRRSLIFPLFFRTLCFCGLRASEAIMLKVDDIDFENGVLTIKNTKSHNDRIIPLNEQLKEQYSNYKSKMGFNGEPSEYFFPAPDGGYFHIFSLRNTFRKCLREAGIPYRGKDKGPRMHDLRHTFAVHSMQKLTSGGQDPNSVLPILATYLGHKSYKGTSRYLHLAAESYPEVIKKSETIFGNIMPTENNVYG